MKLTLTQHIRSICTSIVLTIAILIATAFSFTLTIAASAQPLAQVNTSRTPMNEHSQVGAERTTENLIDDAREKLKDTADTVREKLNLDEPISPSTKEFISDVKEKVSETITGGAEQPIGDRSRNYSD